MTSFAYCDRAGVIGVADNETAIPNGVIVLADGPREQLEERLCARARHAHDGVTLLVPGVPEASEETSALIAFERWHKWAFPGEIWNVHVVVGDVS